jgi:hypothetical protein
VALREMWVNGHSATIEVHRVGRGPNEDVNGVPWTSVIGLRLGWGVVYRCAAGSNHWFHFPVPTLAVDDGVRAHLRRATVLFTADEGATLQGLHVWDGPFRAFAHDDLVVGGENRTPADGRNSFAIPDYSVQCGIGVSAHFHFADHANVTLYAAGVELEF